MRTVLNLLVLVTFVACFVSCNEPDFSDVRPIEFTSESVSEGPDLKYLRFTWTVNATTGITDDYLPVGIDHYRLEVNPDGASGYSQADLNGDGVLNDLDRRPATAVSLDAFLDVHLTDFDNARYQVVARDASDAELARSGELFLLDIAVEQLIGYFKASNTDGGDAFGRVSLSGDGSTLAVGAIGEASNATGIDGDESDNSASDAGAVYVFRRDAAGLWSQEAYVKASNTDAGDEFGSSVSLSEDGSTLAVGAIGEASNATGIDGDESNDSAPDAGAVYVFRRDVDLGTWAQEAYVKASNTGAGDSFGWRVSLAANGSTLAVGAVGEASNATGVGGNQSDDSAPDAGAVYVFRRIGVVWSQQAYVKASNTDAGDEFGSSASLSPLGTALAVGAVGEASNAVGVDNEPDYPSDDLDQDDNSAPDAGAVYVFRRAGVVWSQRAYVKASNTDAGDEFGSSVSLSRTGNALTVGAVGEASNATGIDGDESNNDLLDAGAAYGYVYNTTPDPDIWEQDAYIKASNTDAGDEFGVAVSLSEDGNVLAVGATGEDSNATGIGGDQDDDSLSESGAAYTFRRDPGEDWAQVNYTKASNTDAGDEFGLGVSLSADGNALAVGAELEDSNATGIGGDQSDNSADAAGAAYLY